MDLSRYKTAIFDCDGVILDSNAVKSRAFGLALKGEDPELVSAFVKYHQANGGISRYVKFEYFFTDIKGQIDYESDLKAALNRYAQLSESGLLGCAEIAGVREILTYFKENNIPCHLVSGGDQEEVRHVLTARGLSEYFTGIYGSPVTKLEHLSELKGRNELSDSCIYFGDAKTDLLAANEFDMKFVFVKGVSEWEDGEKVCADQENISVIIDFSRLIDKG
ncbi:MAG: HAD family hydrolase [Oceanospirillaceae bacterium]|nr:HAD family hydrolase [Oceanospirillaceae bacterium]